MAKNTAAIDQVVSSAVQALGFKYVGSEYLPSGGYSVLRVYVEGDQGITIDDCAKISRQVSAALDVEEPIKGQYRLEVSSPGFDRLLFTAEQCEAFVGQKVRMRAERLIEGRRNFAGVLQAVDGEQITLEDEGQVYTLQWADIDRANVISGNDKIGR